MSTIAISLVREHTVKAKPPRAVYVPFPFGLPLGHPHNVREQQAVLDLAFATLERPHGPVLVDYQDEESAQEAGAPLQAADVEVTSVARAADLGTEVTLMRRYWEQRQERTGRTAVGVSGLRPQHFLGIARFLEAYAAGDESDSPHRPPEMPVPSFIRLCVEDLRVLYAEGRMQMRPHETSPDRACWMLGETAFGILLRQLRDRMEASADDKTKAAAFGIAR